jgi:hypothetical protein
MGRRDDILSKIHPKYRGEIEAQLAAQRKPLDLPVIARNIVEAEKPRLKQRRKKISALEERWGDRLKAIYPLATIYPQFPFSVGNNCNYYVDYLVVVRSPLVVMGFEVKGPHAWAASKVKLKAAARMYPWVDFSMVSWVDGQWSTEVVLP